MAIHTQKNHIWADHQTTCDGDVIYNRPIDNRNFNNVEQGNGSFVGVADENSNISERGHHRHVQHSRSLSGHFQDATTISGGADDDDDKDFVVRQEKKWRNSSSVHNSKIAYPTQEARGGGARSSGSIPEPKTSRIIGQKHRRGLSGGKTNPHTSHRRIDSSGFAELIDKCSQDNTSFQNLIHDNRRYSSSESSSSSNSRSTSPFPEFRHNRKDSGRRHRRSDSAGLDLLMVAAKHEEDGGIGRQVEGGIGGALKRSQANYGTRNSPTTFGAQMSLPPDEMLNQSRAYPNSISSNCKNHHNDYESSSGFGNIGYHASNNNYYHFPGDERHQDYRKEFPPNSEHAPPRHRPGQHMKNCSPSYYPSNCSVTSYPRQSYFPPPRHMMGSSKTYSYPVQQQQQQRQQQQQHYAYPPRHSRRNNDHNSGSTNNVPSVGALDHPLAVYNSHHHNPSRNHQLNQPQDHPPFDNYRRQHSFSSCGSEKIETDEPLFSNPPSRNTSIRSSSPVMIPRVSPKLFAQYLGSDSPIDQKRPSIYSNNNGISTSNNDVEKNSMHAPPSRNSSIRALSPVVPRASPKMFAEYYRCSPSDLQTTPQPPSLEVGEVLSTSSITAGNDPVDLSTYEPVDILTLSHDPPPVEKAKVGSHDNTNKETSTAASVAPHEDTNPIPLNASPGVPTMKIPTISPSPSTSPTPIPRSMISSTQPPPSGSWSPSENSDQNTTTPRNSTSNKAAPRRITNGTVSKRVRRKCSVADCSNRVVQGGLCISHGAKRKICGHPGCTKHVKKAGMCSAHGPARKRCDVEGCQKVAVQGGRCISHGAKKKLCSVEECRKQAIFAGMCKRHNDELSSGGDKNSELQCIVIKENNSSQRSSENNRGHQRGLSIFHDINAVDTIINGSQDRHTSGVVDHEEQRSNRKQEGMDPAHSGGATHKRGLSLFSENDVAEKIIKAGIRI